MHDLMFQAGVKGMSERSKLIPCIEYNVCCTEVGTMSMHTYNMYVYCPCTHTITCTCSLLEQAHVKNIIPMF